MKYAEFNLKKEDIITSNGFFEFARNNPDIVFVKPDCLIEERAWYTFLAETPHPKSGFPPKERIWISSHSDHSITDSLIKKYSQWFDKWFSINIEGKDSRLTSIPLGLNSDDRIYSLLVAANQIPRTVEKKAFMSFCTNTCLGERNVVYEILNNKDWITWKYPLTQEEYYTNLRKHPFTICPRGNGYDTHRFWEALYCGSIPVVRENPIVLAFKDKLPIVIIKNWFDLSEEYLDSEYERIMACDTYDDKYLKQSYWNEKILASVEECAKR